MSLEIVFDVAGDDPAILNQFEEAMPDAAVEHLSGIGGLELIGTIAIPTTALLLQIIQMLRDARAKETNTTIVQIHIYEGDKSITIEGGDPVQLEARINEAVAKLR